MSRKNPNTKRRLNKHHQRLLEASEDFEFFNNLTNLNRSDLKDFKEEFEKRQKQKEKKVYFSPRSFNQKKFVDSMENPDVYITAGVGPAGCGKTYLATLYAVKQLQENNVDRIIITRPAVSVDEQHGFLPGDVNKKMEPWLLPILDVFKKYFFPYQIEKMMADGVIEIAPLAYMRGRDFGNSIILADEVQLTTKSQMKMLLTRIGEDSKMILTGDLKQSDRTEDNGLKDFIEKMNRYQTWGLQVVDFDTTDIQRHPVIDQVLKMYD